MADRASRRVVRKLELQLDARDLTLAAELEGCFRAGDDLFVIYPPEQPVLVASSPRSAEPLLVSARYQDGRPLEIVTTPTSRGLRLAFRPEMQTSFRGAIDITTDENRRVLHADGSRGRAAVRVQFLYDSQKPALMVKPDATAAPASGAVPLWFTHRDEIEVELRRNDVRVSVEVSCRGAGAEITTPRQNLHQDEKVAVRLQLPVDGTYRLEARAFRHLGPETEAPKNPENGSRSSWSSRTLRHRRSASKARPTWCCATIQPGLECL